MHKSSCFKKWCCNPNWPWCFYFYISFETDTSKKGSSSKDLNPWSLTPKSITHSTPCLWCCYTRNYIEVIFSEHVVSKQNTSKLGKKPRNGPFYPKMCLSCPKWPQNKVFFLTATHLDCFWSHKDIFNLI